jgi:predicted GNAT family acetyltransferase
MEKSNFERMLQLAEEVFASKNDPNQLDVNEEVMEQLQRIHPESIAEYDNGHGPICWIIQIPTTRQLMEQFLANEISEKELFELTPLNVPYQAVYLCSGMVLQEFRRKGIAKKLAFEALSKIRESHPIEAIFVWAFTQDGNIATESLAKISGLPLFKKEG